MKTSCLHSSCCLAWAALTVLTQVSTAWDGTLGGNDSPNPRSLVSMELVDSHAAETLIDQNAIFWAEFRVRRTGDLTREMVAYLNTQQGSAKLGTDYRLDHVDDGSTLRFAAGAASMNVRLYPIDDEIYEGDESVFFHLIAPPADVPNPYDIDFAHSSVAMVIHDNDPVTTRLEITAPHQDQHFEAGETIELRSQIIGPGSNESWLWLVEFLDGDQRIGMTQPGEAIWWSDATGGPHAINARAFTTNLDPAGGKTLVAEPVTISVGPGPPWPVVSIGVSGRGKTLEPCPACFTPTAAFIISRTGPTNDALIVHLEYDGPATSGQDYLDMPHQITIPAEQKSAHLIVPALDDQLAEGPEIVRATIVSPETATLGYVVSHFSASAMVVIDDDEAGSPDLRLDIVEPKAGAQFAGGSTIEVSALAVWRQGEVDRPVKFFAGDTFIGQSNPPQSARPTIPCLPSVHTIAWIHHPPPGDHVLTARFEMAPGFIVTSPPVSVVIGVIEPPPRPVISIETWWLQENAEAREFCPPNMDCAYPSFVIRRTGATDDPFRVWLHYFGSATPDADYPALPRFIDIPAGKDNVWLMVVPNDDLLVEGPETVVARVIPPPTSPDSRPYEIDPNHVSATITIVDNEQPATSSVHISTEDQIGMEVSILTAIDMVRFRVTRRGDLSQELTVFYSAHGSAAAGSDYRELPATIKIPAGEESADLHVFPVYDQVAEPMETVLIRLEPSPVLSPEPSYEIAHKADEAVGIIFDGPGPPVPAIEIIRPAEGDHFTLPARIEILAAAYHHTRDVLGVDFYAGQTKIGESLLMFDKALSGGLILHRFTWNEPAQGSHALTALGYDEEHTLVATSPAVHVTVGTGNTPPAVRIEGSSHIAEEDSYPFRRIPFHGEFTISRTGPTTDPLMLFVHFSGTATSGVDYPFLPWLVSIPAGAASTQIEVVPDNDDVREGIETVDATLSQCPPLTDPPLGMPCFGGFEIDPAGSRATVFIRDNGLADLGITNPKEGANFPGDGAILIEAVAIDPEGSISSVEFWDGGTRIGESEIVFVQAPPPGAPIYHCFEWHNATTGPHSLTVRTLNADGTVLTSPPVHISVGLAVDGTAITSPASGAEFPPDTPIEIVVNARDPDGYVRKVEFFADGRKIGETSFDFIREPDPGELQTFTFLWPRPTPGAHTLLARSTDNDGATTASAPVEIKVGMSELLPIVIVAAPDPIAVEPLPDGTFNTATFRVRRFGPAAGELPVAYSLRGAAANGIDYEMLSGAATIPAGLRSVKVIVRPSADSLVEGAETVILQLEPPTVSPGIPPAPPYRVGSRNVAVALIEDILSPASPAGARCRPLAGDLMEICFPAEAGLNFRIEATSDLRNWETLFDSVASDGAWRFIDSDTPNHRQRFYRLTPEPVAEAEE